MTTCKTCSRRKGSGNFWKFQAELYRRQMIRVQRRMWGLYAENRRLGGKVYRDIEAAYTTGQIPSVKV